MPNTARNQTTKEKITWITNPFSKKPIGHGKVSSMPGIRLIAKSNAVTPAKARAPMPRPAQARTSPVIPEW